MEHGKALHLQDTGGRKGGKNTLQNEFNHICTDATLLPAIDY